MNIHPVIFSFSVVFALATIGASATEPEYIRSPATTKNNLPFSDAVRVGDLIFLSGQIGNVPGSLRLVDGGIEGEARQAMKNVGSALELAGSSWKHVVKCTVFLSDIKDWPAFNVVYKEFFTSNLPARSALAANGLALGAKVEVECIAALK